MRRRKDYHTKRLSNPYYASHKPRHRLRWWFLAIVLCIIGVIFLSQWDRLTIKTVTVSGNEFTETGAIESTVREQLNHRRWLLFPQQNSIFFSRSATERRLQNDYQFETVRVDTKNFNSIVVTVTERKPVAVVITNGTRYHVDSRGVVIRESSGTTAVTETTANGTAVIRTNQETLTVPEIVDESNAGATVGKQLIPEPIIAFVTAVHQEFKTRADFEVVRYVLGAPGATEVTMVTSEGWQARLNSSEKPAAQVEAVLAVLRDKVSDRSKLEYIDVRFGEKVFYQ